MRSRIRETVLWTGAVLGLLSIVWTVVMFAFGLTPLVFTTGSMSPEIKAGDLAFSRTVDASEVEVGDVVSVINAKGVRITHRVVRTDPTADGAVLTLKGDANSEPDTEPYDVTSVERVSFDVPKAGYVVQAVSSSVGMFVGGLLAAAALFIAFGQRGGGDDRRSGPGESGGRVLAAGVGIAAVALAGGVTAVQPTSAAFSDSAVLGDAIGSATVQPPVSVSCQNVGTSGGSVNLSWAHRDPRYDYVVTLVQDSSGAVEPSRGGTVTGTGAAGAIQTLGVARNFTDWTFFGAGAVQYTARVSSRLKGTPTWTSTTATVKLYETRGLFEFSYRVYCGVA